MLGLRALQTAFLETTCLERVQTDESIEQHVSYPNDGTANMYQGLVGRWVPTETLQVHDAVKVVAPFVDSLHGVQVL